MTLSLLEICQEALEEVGVDPPTTIVSGGDLGVQLHALANTVGRNLAKRHHWQALRTEGNFTTVAAEAQATFGTASSDFPYVRQIIDKTLWNRTQQRRLVKVSMATWNRINAEGNSPSNLIYYIRGNTIRFPSDTAVASESVYFEYVDKRWASNSAGSSYYETFQLDSDIPRLDDHSFVLGVRWMFLKKKGLEYGEEFRMFEDYVSQCIADDETHEAVSLNPYARTEGYQQQIPDGSWNL